jgi:hypothetical protein
MRKVLPWLVPLTLALGCSHVPLSAGDLSDVHRPAFIARVEERAGARSNVFRGDKSYRDKLRHMEPKEADRRLALKLNQVLSRFEVAERIRAGTYLRIAGRPPWNDSVSAAQVATAFESFLVEDVPATAPDYELLRPLGADSIVEVVVEDYGLKSEDGHAWAFARGYGRMFRLDGGEIWHKAFEVDGLALGGTGLDPFKVGKEPELFRHAMRELLETVAVDFAKELTPEGVRLSAPLAPAAGRPDTAPPPSDNELPAQDEKPTPRSGETTNGAQGGEIHMKERKSRSEEEHPSTAPGMQDPSQVPGP